MTEQQYKMRKVALEDEIYKLRNTHCPLSARDRIRKLAKLELEFNDIPAQVTLDRYNYNKK